MPPIFEGSEIPDEMVCCMTLIKGDSTVHSQKALHLLHFSAEASSVTGLSADTLPRPGPEVPQPTAASAAACPNWSAAAVNRKSGHFPVSSSLSHFAQRRFCRL